MSSIYKRIPENRIIRTQNLVNESIPITGSIISGTYNNENIKYFSHRMFVSAYDYPYLSSSSNKLLDCTIGYSPSSPYSSSNNTDNDKKIMVYQEMAKVLMGTDITGTILRFDEDGNILGGGTKLHECIFLNFTRLLYKDEIKRGTFSMIAYTSGTFVAPYAPATFSDMQATSTYFTNAAAGDWSYITMTASAAHKVGVIFYQAGVVVLTASLFAGASGFFTGSTPTMDAALSATNIPSMCDGVFRRIKTLSFLNTVKINSTIVFCDIGPDEFNYSSNPTFLSSSKIRVKSVNDDPCVTYPCGVILYAADNEPMGVGKLSEPLRKGTDQSFTIKARIDW